MKKSIFFFLLGISALSFSQSNVTCEEEVEFKDPNSITKCNISVSNDEDKTESRTAFVKVKPTRSYDPNPLKKFVKSSNFISQKSYIKKKKLENSLENIAILSNFEDLKTIKFHDASVIPLFKKCKTKSNRENVDCFNKQITKHIAKYFVYPEEAIYLRQQGDVWVRFVINIDGEVKNIKTSGPKNGKLLEKEAYKLVKMLPKFKPGLKDGHTVNVSYALPISFSLN